jgi:hypothetical protein
MIADISGHYGTGRIGVPAPNVLTANLVSLWQVEPALFCFLGLYTVVLLILPIFRKQGAPLPDKVRPLLLAACTAITAEVILVMQHPANHYLVPALVLTAFVNAALCVMLPPPSRSNLEIRQLTMVALVVFIGLGLVHNWAAFQRWMDAARTNRQNIAELHATEERLPGCQVIGSDRSSLEVYALSFANGYSAGVHESALEKLYAGTINYDPFHNRFGSFSFSEKDEDVKRLVSTGQCVLLKSTPLDASILKQFDGIRFVTLMTVANPIIPSDPTTLYQLQASSLP